MTRDDFEDLLDDLLEDIPDEFLDELENVEFIVEDRPDRVIRKEMGLTGRETLLGLYQGIPLKHRSPSWYGGVLPDRIIVYQRNIEALARTPRGVRSVLRKTLLHEIAHYFGISDRRLREIGAY